MIALNQGIFDGHDFRQMASQPSASGYDFPSKRERERERERERSPDLRPEPCAPRGALLASDRPLAPDVRRGSGRHLPAPEKYFAHAQDWSHGGSASSPQRRSLLSHNEGGSRFSRKLFFVHEDDFGRNPSSPAGSLWTRVRARSVSNHERARATFANEEPHARKGLCERGSFPTHVHVHVRVHVHVNVHVNARVQ
jgi:hypothetical protein